MNAPRILGEIIVAVCLGFGLGSASGAAEKPIPSANGIFRDDRILVRPLPHPRPGALAAWHAAQGCRVLRTAQTLGGIQVVQLPAGADAATVLTRYRASGLFEYAEPDYLRFTATTTPNDPKFLDGTLWQLNNYGQNGGTAHADIDATDAWDVLNSASNIVVAVLDTGVRYTHEDLAANMWINPNDGVTHGCNTIAGTTDPNDDNGHGTEVTGVLGAVGNNGKGICGVAWKVQIMACKCFTSGGATSDSELVAAMEFAQTNGAQIINASWGSSAYSQTLSNAISSLAASNIIFVAACGNNSANLDLAPYYPACLPLDNVVSVAYTTRTDALGQLSNYGAKSVHLAAPGDQIYTTYSASDTSYFPPAGLGINLAGTSLSAPCVAGALALMLAKFPAENHQQIIARLLAAVDPLPSLAGKCTTGGRLNLRKALSPPISLTAVSAGNGQPFQLTVAAGANRLCVVQFSSDLVTWLPIYTNTTLANGAFTFTDPSASNQVHGFYRATAAP